MSKQLYVWDLHGTLEQGNEIAVVEISNCILEDFRYAQRFTHEMGIELYGLKWHEYFRALIPHISDKAAYELQDACFALSELDTEIQTRCISRTPRAGAVLTEIGKHQRQVLISNTRPETLPIFVKHLHLESHFPLGTYIAVDNHAKVRSDTKSAAVRKLLDKENYDEVIVIGDSSSDMQLAREIEAFGILYNHPYLPRKSLAADLYTSDLRDVLRGLSRQTLPQVKGGERQ